MIYYFRVSTFSVQYTYVVAQNCIEFQVFLVRPRCESTLESSRLLNVTVYCPLPVSERYERRIRDYHFQQRPDWYNQIVNLVDTARLNRILDGLRTRKLRHA